jgi:hypothetical protein
MKGVILKNLGKRKGKTAATQGVLENCPRTALVPNEAKDRELLLSIGEPTFIAPADQFLKIDTLPFKLTRRAMCMISYWAQYFPFAQCAGIFSEQFKFPVSEATIYEVANYVGEIMLNTETERAINACSIAFENQNPDKSDAILYVQLDGSFINTMKPKEKSTKYREVKLGIVFSSENMTLKGHDEMQLHFKINKRDYASFLGNAHTFKMYLYEVAIKNGFYNYNKIVIVTDGSDWIVNICKELFPNAIFILDVFHLYEKICDFSKEIFGSKDNSHENWANCIETLIMDGQVEDALIMIEPEIVHSADLHKYISDNKYRIDYPNYKKCGYYVGSGAIESSNKFVVGKRAKQSGMIWRPTKANNIITLRCKCESGKWTEVEEILDNYDFSLHNANKYPEIINIINNTVDKNSSATGIKKPPGNKKVYSKK